MMDTRKIKEYLLNEENELELFDVIAQLNLYNSCLEYLNFIEKNEMNINVILEDFESYEIFILLNRSTRLNKNKPYLLYTGSEFISYDKEEIREEVRKNIDDILICLMNWYEKIEISNKLLDLILEYYLEPYKVH
jgi:hypothetical protein